MLNNKLIYTARNGLNMRIVICDDNPRFAQDLYKRIHLYCARKEWSIECEIFSSPLKLLASDLTKVQVAFLDIDMPGINGIEVAKQLRDAYPDIVLIFVTAWIEYAPQGYHVNALRYLLKSKIAQEIEPCMEAIKEKLYENKETIIVRQRDRNAEVVIKDILFFEGTSKRAVLMHRRGGSCDGEECLGKLTDYEALMEGKGFLRIQKSFIVNMAHIDKIRNYKAILDNGAELKVSEKNYAEICKRYIMWRGQKL